LKAVRDENKITYKGKSIKITANFSAVTLKQEGHETLQSVKENNFSPRILYPAKL
jgi:hypothetical protein